MLLVLVQTSLATSFLPREQAVLSDANTASRSCGLKTKLESHWDDTCALIVHAEQPEIKFDKASSKKLFRPSKCYLNGLCICGKGPPENTYSTRVVDRITNIMKQVFWSKGSGKDRKTSKPRELLESLEVVLALRPTGGHDAEDKGLWLLLGFVNYKTWKVTVLDLMCAAVAPDGSRAWLQLVDVQASDMEYFLEELDAEDDNGASAPAWLAGAHLVGSSENQAFVPTVLRGILLENGARRFPWHDTAGGDAAMLSTGDSPGGCPGAFCVGRACSEGRATSLRDCS